MTRRLVYAGAFVAFLAAFAMTLAAIKIPRWISWDVTNTDGAPVHYTYGLHERCSSLSGECSFFPAERDCQDEDRYFCSMWRTVGFLMSFTVVLEGMLFIAFGALILGGKQRRVTGWPVLCAMLAIAAAVQAAAMSIVAYLFDHDERFYLPGWSLDPSFALCTASWSLTALTGAAIVMSALVLPEEAGYEMIPESDP